MISLVARELPIRDMFSPRREPSVCLE